MTPRIGLLVVTFSFACATLLHAGNNPFPKQPKINDAYKELVAAGNQVKLARTEPAAKHLDKASNRLAAAKSNLEEAKKNKGSARPSAIALIEQAQTEVEAGKTDPTHLDKAADCITQALAKVKQAGENGR